MAENALIVNRPPEQVDESAFDYNVDAPVRPLTLQGVGGPLIPEKPASEDSLMAAFIEYGSPKAEQVLAIQKEYENRGASQVIEDIRSRGADKRNQNIINTEVNKMVNGEQSLDDLSARLESTPAWTPDQILDLHQEYLSARLFRTQAKTPEQQIIAEQKIAELVTQGYPVDRAVADRIEWLKSTLNPNAFALGVGILTDIIPYATTIPFVRAFNKVFPDAEAGILDLPRGELATEIRTRMEAMSPEERFQVASDFMDAIMENDNLLTGQDFQRMMIFQEALEGGFTTVDRVIGDAITLLDSVGAGGVAKGLWRLGKSTFLPGSPVSTVNLADQVSAAQLAAQGIKVDMKSALGMDQIDLIEVAAGVKNSHSDVELLPADIIKILNKGKEESLDIINRTRGNILAIKEAERSLAAREIRHQLQEVGQNGFYGSNFTADKLEDGLAFRAKYGVRDSDGNTHPFTSAREAMDAAKHTFPDATKVTIFRRSPKGRLTPVKPSQVNKRVGEYVYEVQGFKSYATVLNPTDKLFFQEGDILHSGPLAKWFLDPASRFSRWMSEAFAQAGDQGRGIRAQLSKIAEPFVRIPNHKKREVVKLLNNYAKNSATMDTSAILRAAGNDLDVLKGFYSYRQTMDTLWHLENRGFRQDLQRQGAKHIVIDDFQGVGVKQGSESLSRAVERAADRKVEVYDAVKGTMVQLDQNQVTKLLADGKSIYKVREPIGDITRQSDLVMVTKADEVRELPAAVLKKIDGYIPRHYKETYWVRRIVKGTKNGRSTQNFQVLRAVGDKAEANQVVRELVASGTLTKDEAARAISHDRALNPIERATIEQQDQISLGRMFYHKRSDMRVLGIDGFAEISDPVEAMVKNIDSTARFVGNDELLTTMKTRWVNTFGKQLGLVDPKKGFPQNRVDIGGALSGTPAEKAQALEMWDHIRKTESIMTTEGEAWRNFWITAADKIIGDSAADTIAGAAKQLGTWPLRVLAENSPNKLLRSVAFFHLIAANPIRQAYVQSQQWLFISALAPKLAPQIMLQNKAVMLGLMARESSPAVYKAGKNAAAKVMGMSTKEYDNFIDQFRKTGIPDSIDSHDYVANSLVEYSKNVSGNMATRALRGAWNVGIAPFQFAKKVGFDYGERSNLINSFLIARHRFLKATGKKQLTTRGDFTKTAADARNLALDMTSTGAFRYQDGALSALTQFLSIQHKAMLAILPFKKLGNQAFTRAERLKIATGQLVLNGVTGLGLYELYKGVQNQTGHRVDPKYEKFIVGGMYEYVMNNIFEVLTGEKTDLELNFAGAVSPASGINQKLGDVVEVLLNNEPWTDMMASTNVVNRWLDVAETMQAMQKFPELNKDEDYQNMISNFATITSGWNQFIKARAAMRLGWHVSTHGNPTIQASFGSAVVEGTFGLHPRTMEEFYALQDEYAEGMRQENHLFKDADTETSEVAQAMYRSMTRIVTLFDDEFDPDIQELNTDQLTRLHLQRMREGLSMMASIKALYTPIERDRIWQKFEEKAKQDRTRGGKGLIDSIINKIVSGDLSGDEVQPVISRIMASGLVKPGTPEAEEIKFIVNELFKSMQGREELSNFNNERIQEQLNGDN